VEEIGRQVQFTRVSSRCFEGGGGGGYKERVLGGDKSCGAGDMKFSVL